MPSIVSPAFRSRLATAMHSLTGPSSGMMVGSPSMTIFATVSGVSRLQRQDGSGKYVETEAEVKLGHNSTSPSDQGGSSRSQNPFEKPNKGNDAPENNEGNGDAQNPEQELPKEGGGESSPSDEELWEQFRQFFDQYQR